MEENLFKQLEFFRKQHGLSILSLCRQMGACNVTYHRWKKAKKITGLYKKIVKEFLDKNENVLFAEVSKSLQANIAQPCPKPTSDIAVIGIACLYPGANNPKELWENILSRRVQFRRLLDERLPLKDYYDQDHKAADKIYLTKAAFMEGFEFNWSKLRIPRKTFESTDIVHWLALDVALKAFEDANYKLDKIPLQNTGVILGNTLTGEQTRSQTLRLRWPYVNKTLNATLETFGVSDEDKKRFSEALEKVYKSAFYPITEDSLAGGLANTIAGRICNYLNLKGGGYIVDGACSSSLLAVTTAANALSLREIDLALAGGVDVSLDPFELVGFSKAGALAKDQMCVYDKRADGFLPGEGCGFVVLKRLDDAVRDRNYIYAVIKGWGVSSDGKGGIMEPSVSGQALAIERAYKHLAHKISDIDFVEGHGTGTTKGDRVELEGIATAIKKHPHENSGKIYGVTSFKSIVGHTKAAAGIGGFIKAVLAVNQRILPPTANCTQPNEVFEKEAKGLYPIMQGSIYSKDKIMRAGISSAGFGGINCHVAIESKDNPNEKIKPGINEQALFVNNQNTEIFVFASRTILHLRKLIQKFKEDLRNISLAEMADLSARLNLKVKSQAPIKIAIVTDTPEHLYEALLAVEKELESNSLNEGEILEIKSGDPVTNILLSNRAKNNRIGFLYPGQGAQKINMTRTLVERFKWAKDLLKITNLPIGEYIYKPEDQLLIKEEREDFKKKLSETQITQPAICFSSLVWTEFLSKLGIEPIAVSGHSLGELTAFYKAGAFDTKTFLHLAEIRGKLMAEKSESAGMLSLFCDASRAEKLLSKTKSNLVISNLNSPNQTVVSGSMKDIQDFIKLANSENITTHLLPVSNAFHSYFMQNAAQKIGSEPALKFIYKTGNISMYSGIDGSPIKGEIKLSEYFSKQILSPVNFIRLIESMSKECDIFIEVGPGRILTDLVNIINKNNNLHCFPLEATPRNDRDINIALAQMFIRNIKIKWEELYSNRVIKPFVPASRKKFIKNQCERPLKALTHKEKLSNFKVPETMKISGLQEKALSPVEVAQTVVSGNADSIANILLELTCKLTGFERESLSLNLRLLDDLNMDSIKAAELIAEAGKILGISGQIDPSQYSNNTLLQIRDQLVELKNQAVGIAPLSTNKDDVIDRYRNKTWTRDFVVKFIEEKIKQKDSSLLKRLNKINILCEENQTKQASSLKDGLKSKTVEITVISDESIGVSKEKLSNPDCLIYILPANQDNGSFEEKQLKQIINRFHHVMSIATRDDIRKTKTIVFVQFGGGNFGENEKLKNIASSCAKSFASTLHLERPDLCIKIIGVDQQLSSNVISGKIIEELQTPGLFSIAGYDKNLQRKVPVFSNTHPVSYKKRNIFWSSKDVIFVTGGAKGITAECALEFAKKTRAQMILVGRSKFPTETNDQNNEIVRTLSRFEKEGLQCKYYPCDVTNFEEVTQVIDKIENNYGKITAIIHGAGLNTLKRLKQTDPEGAYYEALPKVMGAINVCKALEKNPLKLIVGITSIIGITGMEGSGWYGLSNEILNLFLHQFKVKHKKTEIATIAYSVWDEIGMGTKLKSLEWLLNKGIHPIPVNEGIKRFLHLIETDSGSQQTIVTARIGGIDTWRPLLTNQRKNLRFIEDIKYYMPGVELIGQAHLNIKDDSYVLDHSWKGTLLFPFVFGLEAMTQAALTIIDDGRIDYLTIKDAHLDRPITINQERGTTIEIHAQALEKENTNEKIQRVKVEIYSEETGYEVPHFFAILELNVKTFFSQDNNCSIFALKNVINLNPQINLYSQILFQGKLFQCIKRIHKLSYNEKKHKGECVLTSEQAQNTEQFLKSTPKFNNHFLIIDPFLVDSLFQSMQLIIPQDLSLPRKIEKISMNISDLVKGGKAVVIHTHIHKISNEQGIGNAEAFKNNDPVISVANCDLKIIQTTLEKPSANDLVDPSSRDQRNIEEKLNQLAKEFNLSIPAVKCFYTQRIKKAKKEDRHNIEIPLIKQAVKNILKKYNKQKELGDTKIGWLKTGQPILIGAREEIGISVTHTDSFLMVVAGYGKQGCDIEIVKEKTNDDWLALLGKEKFGMLKKIAIDGVNNNDAGIAIWSAVEAAKKGGVVSDDKKFKFIDRRTDIFLFNSLDSGKNLFIISFVVFLTLEGKAICSLIIPGSQTADLSLISFGSGKFGYEEDIFKMDIVPSGPCGGPTYIKRFPLTFKNNQSIRKCAYFTNFFEWMGTIREYALQPVMNKIAALTLTGNWGIATNSVRLKITGELKANDIVECHLWMGPLCGEKKSTFNLMFDWFKVIKEGKIERIAISEQKLSWIKIIGHGLAYVENMPREITNFLNPMASKNNHSFLGNFLQQTSGNLDIGKRLLSFEDKKIEDHLLHEHVFLTTLEDSNLVGNIYFSNYAKWLGRVIDLYFYNSTPRYYQREAKEELYCLSCEMVHNREAMPFDKILIKMFLSEIYEKGIELYFEYFILRSGNKQIKIASAKCRMAFIKENSSTQPIATNLPTEILGSLKVK